VAYPFIDTDVIIRLLTGDDPVKQQRAASLFEQIERGDLTVTAPVTVIADAVFVLSSYRLYNLPRHEIASALAHLVRIPNFRVKNRRAVLAALDIYGSNPFKLDFGDAFILASMMQSGSRDVYSFDAHFDRMPGINRLEPD